MTNKKTVIQIICGACAALTFVPENEDFWGCLFSGVVCGLCGVLGFKLGYENITAAARIGKKVAKGVKAAKEGKKFIEERFGPGPDFGG